MKCSHKSTNACVCSWLGVSERLEIPKFIHHTKLQSASQSVSTDHVCVQMYVCVCECMHVGVYVGVDVCMYVCMYLCVCV